MKTSETASDLKVLIQNGRYDVLVERATQLLKQSKSITETYDVLRAVILRHPDHLAAMPLLEIVYKEIWEAPAYIRLTLSSYEFRCVGSSRLADTLPPTERQQYIEGIEYLCSHPLKKELEIADDLMSGQFAVNATQAGERIIAAVFKKIPMSVVRMGDGEGRFMLPLDPFPATKLHADEIARRIWFWNSGAITENFWEDLRNAYRNADIVGVFTPRRVDFEYRNVMYGYIGVVNGNRFLSDLTGAGKAPDRAPNVLFGQLNDEYFSRLFDAAKTVKFIGPHPKFEEVLLKKGAKAVRTVLTPSDNMVPNAVDRPHHPDVYDEIISMCRSGKTDGLWLVSSGAHAKIYCDEIKKAGGVALDFGSLSDRWMGLKTP